MNFIPAAESKNIRVMKAEGRYLSNGRAARYWEEQGFSSGYKVHGMRFSSNSEFLLVLLVLALLVWGQQLGAQSRYAPNDGVGLKVRSGSLLVSPLSFAPAPLYLPALEAPERRPLELLAFPELPRAYSYDKLGIFCKWEVQLEKAARMPVKFRLGEVQYVERLEGKLPAY